MLMLREELAMGLDNFLRVARLPLGGREAAARRGIY